ncbi:formate C-acetyltransferase [Klebsiella pneumoniae]|uniref:Formate C-acetyltransferase n=1 Tax=Klebsiella pneumoniae TaxID=573 RepID=A0A378G233_KLEPN|nr:formate C-acetyltransferase [Klebsiella pneumoniae]
MKVDIDTQDVRYADAWLGFRGTAWQTQIDVRDFIQHNYTPYEGDESFLADATPATTALWEQVMAGIRVENATHGAGGFRHQCRHLHHRPRGGLYQPVAGKDRRPAKRTSR